jgi:hypothetical protein
MPMMDFRKSQIVELDKSLDSSFNLQSQTQIRPFDGDKDYPDNKSRSVLRYMLRANDLKNRSGSGSFRENVNQSKQLLYQNIKVDETKEQLLKN